MTLPVAGRLALTLAGLAAAAAALSGTLARCSGVTPITGLSARLTLVVARPLVLPLSTALALALIPAALASLSIAAPGRPRGARLVTLAPGPSPGLPTGLGLSRSCLRRGGIAPFARLPGVGRLGPLTGGLAPLAAAPGPA